MAQSAVTAIVLAGGRSSRFGADKLAVTLDGRRLLDHAIAAVAAVAGEVIVVGAPGADRVLPPCVVPLRLVHDADLHRGPLAGLLTGASAAEAPRILVVGGDMPTLVPEVLRLLCAALAAHDAAVLADGAGIPRQLPLAVRRDVAIARATGTLNSGGTSLRAFLEGLGALAIISRDDWRAVDPDASTMRDVDRPEDLPAG